VLFRSTCTSAQHVTPPYLYFRSDNAIDSLQDDGISLGSFYNLVVPLGHGPSDLTLYVHTQHDSLAQHLERCLEGRTGEGGGEDR